jgi:hypothetical protein
MRNRTEELSLMRVKNAALEERIKVLEARLEPKPPPRVPEIPAWAGSGDPNMTGMNAPAPSVVPTGDGVNWIRERRANGDWKDPFGQWRYQSGELIPRQIEPQPLGPQRDHQHDQNVALLDRIVPTFKE